MTLEFDNGAQMPLPKHELWTKTLLVVIAFM